MQAENIIAERSSNEAGTPVSSNEFARSATGALVETSGHAGCGPHVAITVLPLTAASSAAAPHFFDAHPARFFFLASCFPHSLRASKIRGVTVKAVLEAKQCTSIPTCFSNNSSKPPARPASSVPFRTWSALGRQHYADEVRTDRHGNVLAVRHAVGDGPASSAPRASCWPATAIRSP